MLNDIAGNVLLLPIEQLIPRPVVAVTAAGAWDPVPRPAVAPCLQMMYNRWLWFTVLGSVVQRLLFVGNLPSDVTEATLSDLFPDALRVILPHKEMEGNDAENLESTR